MENPMKKLTLAIALSLCASPAFAADTCTLQSLGTLALTVTADGTIAVPVALAGSMHPMALDFSVPQTALSDGLADSLSLSRETLRGGYTYHGAMIKKQATVPTLGLGAMTGRSVSVLVLPASAAPPSGVEGILGSLVLGASDLEIDFAQSKVTLFSPEHCAGQGVTWSDSAAIVPFKLNDAQRVVFAMQLDGKDVSVAIGTGGTATMPLSAARRLFGMGYNAVTAPPHFNSLSAGGIAIANPQVRVIDDSADGCHGPDQPLACIGRADLNLSLSQLKGLHLFFAFGEGTLYATAAGAHR